MFKSAKRVLGFTLIELVIVIVILGILAAVAVPKFINLSQDAQNAATQGVAGALSSASASNYGARVVNTTAGSAVTNCTDASTLLTSMPSGYTISSLAVAAPNGTAATCTLTGTTNGVSSTASFQAIRVT